MFACRNLALSLLLLLVATAASGQNPAADLVARAGKAYAEQKYAESADLFGEAIAAGADDGSTLYNAACAAALAGRRDGALDLLARAVDAGFTNTAHMRRDTDLASLHDTPRFASILAEADEAQARRDRFWKSPAMATPFAENLTEDEKVAGLSRIWSEAKFNFIYFDQLPELDWDALYVSYLPRVRATSSTLEYYRVLMSFIAALKDGHTNINLPAQLQPLLTAEPAIRLGEYEGCVYVNAVHDASLADLRGMEVLAIDGVAVSEFAATRVRPYQSASTPQDLASRTTRRLLWGAESTDVALTLTDAGGNRTQRTVRRLTLAEEKTIVPPPPSFAYRMLPGNIAYVALNQFGDSKAAEEYEKHFAEIAKASALIIDVRRNGGGDSSNGYRVLATLRDRPFETSRWATRDYKPTMRAWGRAEETFHGEAGEVQPSGTRLFQRPVVVLTAPETYSAAEDFVVAFDAMKRGTIIGEPTGGSTGQPLMFTLPGGGGARVCTKRDTYPDGKRFVGVGIQPQVLVHPRVADLRAEKDTVLEAAVAFLTQGGVRADSPGRRSGSR